MRVHMKATTIELCDDEYQWHFREDKVLRIYD